MNPGNNPDTRQSPGSPAEDGAQALAGGLFGRHRRLVIGSAVFLLVSSAAGAMLASRILAPLKHVNAPAHTGDAHKAQIVIREQYNALQIIPQVSPASPAVAAHPAAPVASGASVAARPAAANSTTRRVVPASSAPVLAMAPSVPPSSPEPGRASSRPAPATAVPPTRPAPVTVAPVRLAASPARAAQKAATPRPAGPQVQVAQTPARPPVRPVSSPPQVAAAYPVIAKGHLPVSRPLAARSSHPRQPAPARRPQAVVLATPVQKRTPHRPVIATRHDPAPVVTAADQHAVPTRATAHLAQVNVPPLAAPHVSAPRRVDGQARLVTTQQASRPGHSTTPAPATSPSPSSRLIAQAATGAVRHPAPTVWRATGNAQATRPNKTGGATHLASAPARPGAGQQIHPRTLHIRPVKPVVVEGDDEDMPRRRIASARMAPDPYDEMDDEDLPPRYDAPPRYYSPPPAYPGYMYRPPPPAYYPGW